jgi:hypothetical protein
MSTGKPFHQLDHAMKQAREMAIAKGELACVYLVTGKYAARPKRKALAAMAKHNSVSIVPNTTYNEEGELCPEVAP